MATQSLAMAHDLQKSRVHSVAQSEFSDVEQVPVVTTQEVRLRLDLELGQGLCSSAECLQQRCCCRSIAPRNQTRP